MAFADNDDAMAVEGGSTSAESSDDVRQNKYFMSDISAVASMLKRALARLPLFHPQESRCIMARLL